MDQITGCGSDSIESCNFGDTDAAAGVVAESLHLLIDDPPSGCHARHVTVL